MSSWLQQPAEEMLKGIVECYWSAADSPEGPLVLPPAVSNDVILSFEPPTTIWRDELRFGLGGNYFSGVRTKFFQVDQHGRFQIVGIRFRPWVFALYFGLVPEVHLNTFAPTGNFPQSVGVFDELNRLISRQASRHVSPNITSSVATVKISGEAQSDCVPSCQLVQPGRGCDPAIGIRRRSLIR